MEHRANEIFTTGNHIFNSKYWDDPVVDTITGIRSAIIDPAARLMTMDPNTLINYANLIHRFKLSIDNFLTPRFIKQKERANDLMGLINKEYHLK